MEREGGREGEAPADRPEERARNADLMSEHEREHVAGVIDAVGVFEADFEVALVVAVLVVGMEAANAAFEEARAVHLRGQARMREGGPG
jgi:hypothetical protein